MTLQKN